MSPQWARRVFYIDSTCSRYAGEIGTLLNTCVPNQNNGASYVKLVDTNIAESTTITETFYADSSCTTPVGNPFNELYDQSCLFDLNNYYYSNVISQEPAYFPINEGMYFQTFTTEGGCNGTSASVVSQYYFQVYNTAICMPGYDGQYSSAVSCGESYSSSNSDGCGTAALANFTKDINKCNNLPVTSTAGGFVGYPYVQCYTKDNSDNNGVSVDAVVIGVTVGFCALVIIAFVTIGWCYWSNKKNNSLLGGEGGERQSDMVPVGGSASRQPSAPEA